MSTPPDSGDESPPDSESPPSPVAPPPPPPKLSTPSPPSPAPEKSAPAPPTQQASPPPKASPPPLDSSLSPPKSGAPPPASSGSNDGNPSPPSPPHSPSHAFSPPPPPRSSSSSSPSTNSLSSPTSNNSGLTGDQIKVVVGVTLGLGLVIIAMVIICACCCRKKKRKHEHMQYFGGGIGSEQFSHNPLHPNWHNSSSPADHVVGVGWHGQPPPPSMMMSGEMSSTYSGPHRPPLPPPSPNIVLGFNQSTFTYEELAAATGGFSESNLLGQGGFGYVHKGVLPNGKEVAVKSLKSGSGQGEREFQAEVEIISRVHHRHLVSLKGYCIAGGQRMLVYEFVPNKTLEYHLHGKGLPVMDWPTRLRIALGSAKGLAYLHEDCHPRIIHRDIKSANILLDFNFEAMVADFGLAKLSSDNYTHVSTRVMGTFGYLAPEYASSGKLTEKSDVFSFGVMLLEIMTGKRPMDPTAVEDSLVDWARPLLTRALEEGNYNELVDFRLENNYHPQEMQRLVACIAASIRHSAKKRPRMSQIVRALEGDASLDDLNDGPRPGHSSAFNSSNGSPDIDRFKQVTLSSQEFNSSEHLSSSNDSRDTSTSVAQRTNF